MIDELAASIAVLLADESEDEHDVITVTTPDAIGLQGLAALASEIANDRYTYEPSDPEPWIAYRRGRGRPEWSIEAGLSYYQGVALGEADVTGYDYERLTGRNRRRSAPPSNERAASCHSRQPYEAGRWRRLSSSSTRSGSRPRAASST